MVQTTRMGWWLIGLAVVAGFIAYIVFFARPADPQQMAIATRFSNDATVATCCC